MDKLGSLKCLSGNSPCPWTSPRDSWGWDQEQASADAHGNIGIVSHSYMIGGVGVEAGLSVLRQARYRMVRERLLLA